MHNMLIYANQVMTSHQYNYLDQGHSVGATVWPPVWNSVNICSPSSFLGEGGSKLFKWHTLPHGAHGHGPKGHNFSF